MKSPQTPESVVRLALEEDIGAGDLTTRYFCDAAREASARIITRQDCVLAGVNAAAETFRQVDAKLALKILHEDGAELKAGDVVLEARGSAASLLTAERTALNFIQRLSGIATLTRAFVSEVSGTRTRILDTRKTTPGLRLLEKAAVRAGGGSSYRMGLYDMVMVKDNHLAACNSQALQEILERLKKDHPAVKVEFEADRLDQVSRFLDLRGVDRILLDNMSLSEIAEAVRLAGGRVELEASGGVKLENVRAIAETGVDFISIGALTHSAKAVDFSLEFDA